MSSEFDLFLGPIINAAFFAVFFFGVITMQIDQYIRNHFTKDPLYIKSFVRCCVPEPPPSPSPCATGPFLVVRLGPPSPILLTGFAKAHPCGIYGVHLPRRLHDERH
jgi:hypothetical protein